MMDLPYIVALYCVGLILMVVETLTPGMIVGLIGTAMMAAAVVFAFIGHDVWVGLSLIAIAAAAVPTIFFWGLKRMALKTTLSSSDGIVTFAHGYNALVGREGAAQTPLHPGGIAVIDGKKYDVVTEGSMIDRGARIRVISVEGNRIVVKSV